MRRATSFAAVALAALALGVARSRAEDPAPEAPFPGPEHPRELAFPPLRFEPPSPALHRRTLENGLVAYVVPDASIPIVRVRALIRAGSAFDPEGKEGLAALAFRAVAAGGAGDLAPDRLRERLDALSATLEGDARDLGASLDLWVPRAHADEALAILGKALAHPLVDADRLAKLALDARSEAQGEEDDARQVALRRARAALLGDHPLARARTRESVAAIERADVLAFLKRALVPGRVVLAISGAIDRETADRALERHFAGFRGEGTGWPSELPRLEPRAPRGVVVVDRPVSQSHLLLARPGIAAGSPDEPALAVADHLLGSGSFTARIVLRVRGDEGLSYSVGSEYDASPLCPGLVKIELGCRARETSYALALVAEELRRFAREGPTQEELAAAKAAIVGRFPARFASAHDAAVALADGSLAGLPDEHLARWRERILALDAEAVRKAAARWFDPDGMAKVVVGPADEMRTNHERGTTLDDLGEVSVER